MLIPKSEYESILRQMPILCVDAVIIHENKCLLLLRDNEPAKGTYWFPGGRVYKNETIETAVLRKAKEETNLLCSFEKVISVEESFFEKTEGLISDIHTVNVCCLLRVENIEELKTDRLHNGFIWEDKLRLHYHTCVNNPLALLDFTY